jgi:hypothetical protein
MMKCALERTNELFPGFKSLLEAKNYAEITNCCGELELVVSHFDSQPIIQNYSKNHKPIVL